MKLVNTAQGPIVRINPEELHCDDYDFVDEIYPSVASRIRDKQPHFLAAFAGPLTVSSFGTRDHEVCFSPSTYFFFKRQLLTLGCQKTHRIRRGAVNKFFSRQRMLQYAPQIHEMAQRMCDKVLRRAESGQIINALDPYNCFTADAISQYCFGEPFGTSLLSSPALFKTGAILNYRFVSRIPGQTRLRAELQAGIRGPGCHQPYLPPYSSPPTLRQPDACPWSLLGT